MEFKKCERCGGFYTGISVVCESCISKENLDMSKLKNYFEMSVENGAEITNDIIPNMDTISYETGITTKNLTRQLQNNIIFKDN